MKHNLHSKTKDSKEDVNAYGNLCRRSEVPCDLCDVVSKSRYSSYIHNMKHMIIPLVNLTIYKCQQCLHISSSQEELKKHKILHNLNAMVVIPKLELPSPEIPKNCNIIGSIPLKHKIIFESPEKESIPPKLPASSIKSRLLFEDDVPDLNLELINSKKVVDLTDSPNDRTLEDLAIDTQDRILEDLTIDCQVQVELLPTFETKSIHYEELIKPGLFKCKICFWSFPTRFDAITHESSHIYLKNSQITYCTVCNFYINGNEKNMKEHILFAHRPSMEADLMIVPDNVTNYENHKFSQSQPGEKKIRLEFEEDVNLQEYNECYMNLCDVCMTFCRNYNLKNIRYTFVETVKEWVGKQFSCEECAGVFHYINIVKRQTKLRKTFTKSKKKALSNMDRLKSIKQRFKLMKKMYFCVLF